MERRHGQYWKEIRTKSKWTKKISRWTETCKIDSGWIIMLLRNLDSNLVCINVKGKNAKQNVSKLKKQNGRFSTDYLFYKLIIQRGTHL